MPVMKSGEKHVVAIFALPPGMAYQFWQGGYHAIMLAEGELGKLAEWLETFLKQDILPAAQEERDRLAAKQRFELDAANEAEAKRIASILAMVPSSKQKAVEDALLKTDAPPSVVETIAPETKLTAEEQQSLFDHMK